MAGNNKTEYRYSITLKSMTSKDSIGVQITANGDRIGRVIANAQRLFDESTAYAEMKGRELNENEKNNS